MGLFGKIMLGLMTAGAMGSLWAATAGWGAKDLGGKSGKTVAKGVGKSARHGSAGRGGRYHSWK